MKCPVCPTATLVMTERQGIEIDYCPSCRGVWLDRGELDKLIERSAGQQAPPAQQQAHQAQQQGHLRRDSSGRLPAQGGYRRKSWLGELFD
jgi:Zn-finger nucleic acid-binding protein